MRNNVIQFTPNEKLNSAQNLENYINHCKNNLSAFGQDCWDKDTWKTTLGNRKVTTRFSTNLEERTGYSFKPISQPLLEFAKAYIRESYTKKPVVNLQRRLEAIRILEELLLKHTGTSNILYIDGPLLADIYPTINSKNIVDSSKNTIGNIFVNLFSLLRETRILPSLPEWENPFPKPKDLTIELSPDGEEHRSSKLPSEEIMILMADLFYRGPSLSVEAEYFSALYAILMTAPSRGSELASLSVDCLVWEEDEIGSKRLGIQWTPAKNGKAGVKWVPSAMQDIVIEAINRIKRISEPARKAAKFAEDFPNMFWIHPNCITPTGFSIYKPLNIEQINAAVSTNHSNFYKLNNSKWSKKLLADNNNEITYCTLGRYHYDHYTKNFPLWPYIDKNKKLKVSEALALFRENEFNEDLQPRLFSFYHVTTNTLNKRFANKNTPRYKNLWERHGIFLSNGDKVNLSTHQARHWLCTMAESGGMGDVAIANWAGRAQIRDNDHYDHRSESEKGAGVRKLMLSESPDILTKISRHLPVTFADIGRDLPGSAIVTELGVCEHDYAVLPCHRHGDCETCKELVCVKGFSDSLALLRQREREVAIQLKKALSDHELGFFGADRWVSNHAWRLAHLQTKIRLLEDDSIPDGTPVRVPEEFDPTPVKETLMRKGMTEDLPNHPNSKFIEDILRLAEKNA